MYEENSHIIPPFRNNAINSGFGEIYVYTVCCILL